MIAPQPSPFDDNPTEPFRPDEVGQRLVRALREYEAEMRSGRRPDRDAFLARYPDLADVLGPALCGLELLPDVGATEGTLSIPSDLSLSAVEAVALGDFRLLREVGRGGMGIVYEAEQRSLGRHVALKVLPLAGALDPRHLRRFKAESQAAARLRHDHIVPIYLVGCERGVHFYAMQFIEGQSLAALIEQRRAAAPVSEQTYFFTVARLIHQAALALDHAHEHGIVHRDVKPSNLLLDREGKLWVTDFGLAQVATDVGMTLTGDVLGTLRYMSPEQARGERERIDRRSDVYGLGATLYELLTLSPPFPGEDREELLRQITNGEPRPPSRLNRVIPADLETIVLKALAGIPADRYATAREMADDLQRFLEGRPVRARRTSLGRRLLRWAGRYRGLLTAACAMLVVGLIVGLSVGLIVVWRAQQRTEAAYRAEARHRRRAEETGRLARQAVDELYTQVAENHLADTPGMERVRRDLLEKAARFYEQLAREDGDEPDARFEQAQAYHRLAIVDNALGRWTSADEAESRAAALLEALIAETPHEPRYRFALARCLHERGAGLVDRGRMAEAEPVIQKTLGLVEALVRDHPGEPEYHATAAALATLHSVVLRTLGRPAEAIASLRRAVGTWGELLEDHPAESRYHLQRAVSCGHLSFALRQSGELREAESWAREALRQSEATLKEDARNPIRRARCARHARELAELLLDDGRSDDAEPFLRRHEELVRSLTREFPDNLGHRWLLAEHHQTKARCRLARGQPAESQKELREAAAVLEGILQKSDTAAWRNDLAWFLASGPSPDAKEVERSIRLARRNVSDGPRNGWYQRTLGVALYRSGRWDEAATALQEALRLLPHPDGAACFYLAMSRQRQGDFSRAREANMLALRILARTPRKAELRRLHEEASKLDLP